MPGHRRGTGDGACAPLLPARLPCSLRRCLAAPTADVPPVPRRCAGDGEADKLDDSEREAAAIRGRRLPPHTPSLPASPLPPSLRPQCRPFPRRRSRRSRPLPATATANADDEARTWSRHRRQGRAARSRRHRLSPSATALSPADAASPQRCSPSRLEKREREEKGRGGEMVMTWPADM